MAQVRFSRAEYRQWYNKGWRSTASLDYADSRGYPEPWYDGFFDQAAAREKWHHMTCLGCGEHDNPNGLPANDPWVPREEPPRPPTGQHPPN